MKRETLAWGPAVLWALVLFLLSELRDVPVALDPFLILPDKLVHFGVYLVLGSLLAWAQSRTRLPTSHLLLVALGSAYGALDEWHQSFVPGRTPDVGDWLANTAGVTFGYLATTFFGLSRPGTRRRTEHDGKR